MMCKHNLLKNRANSHTECRTAKVDTAERGADELMNVRGVAVRVPVCLFVGLTSMFGMLQSEAVYKIKDHFTLQNISRK